MTTENDQIGDEELRRLLELTAEVHELPGGGAAAVLAARDAMERPSRTSWSPRRRPARERAAGRNRSMRLVGAGLALGAVVIGAGVGLGQLGERTTTSESSVGGAAAGSRALPAPVDPRSGASPGAATSPTSPTSPTAPSTPAGSAQRIVSNGEIALAVDTGQVPQVLDRLGAAATAARGYIASSSSQDRGGREYGSITLRVPADAYPQLLAQARSSGRVTSSSSTSEDVSGRYVDLDARIRALQQTRATYLALLAKAGTIGETLSVQQQITSTQTEIEQLQGQQKLLADQAELATVEVMVTEPVPARVSDSSSDDGFRGAFAAAVDGFSGGLQRIVAASGPLLLVALVGAVLFWPVRGLVRLARRRMI